MSGAGNDPRSVVAKFFGAPRDVGDGTIVRQSIGSRRPEELRCFDPFLIWDEYSIAVPGEFPDHPHRGFDAVTYMLQGAVKHANTVGHSGTIEAGDVQWLTAGRGIIHTEVPVAHGTQKGLQLWINLPSKHRMIEPRYQEIKSKDVPEASKDGVNVRIIAGESLGVESRAYSITPIMYLDFNLNPGAHLQQPIPISWNAFVYVLEGEGVFVDSNSSPTTAHHLLTLSSGDGLEAWNKSSEVLRFVLVGGEPLGEPMARSELYVMNTKEELDQTRQDYKSYTNGFEKAKNWRSEAALSL